LAQPSAGEYLKANSYCQVIENQSQYNPLAADHFKPSSRGWLPMLGRSSAGMSSIGDALQDEDYARFIDTLSGRTFGCLP
jgi:hypothetical protein